jgi:tRNA (guanine-N7-)-methyltransferase
MRPFSPNRLPAPPDLAPLGLNSAQPVDVEIGCGVGMHPIRYARDNPGRQLVAIERTREKFEKFTGRLLRHEPLPNLKAIHGDALAWITHGFAPESVDRFLVLYPNPYPKPAQRNQRFHYMPFLAQLRATLKSGGELWLATNEAFYAEEARRVYPADWGMELVEDSLVSPSLAPRTHFEKKYLARGEACFNLRFTKLS